MCSVGRWFWGTSPVFRRGVPNSSRRRPQSKHLMSPVPAGRSPARPLPCGRTLRCFGSSRPRLRRRRTAASRPTGGSNAARATPRIRHRTPNSPKVQLEVLILNGAARVDADRRDTQKRSDGSRFQALPHRKRSAMARLASQQEMPHSALRDAALIFAARTARARDQGPRII